MDYNTSLYNYSLQLENEGKIKSWRTTDDISLEFVIHINEDGSLQNNESPILYRPDIKCSLYKSGRTSDGAPNYFFDDSSYVFCDDVKNKRFIQQCKDISNRFPDNSEFSAVVKFYEKYNKEELLLILNKLSTVKEFKKSSSYISFIVGNSCKTVAESELIEVYIKEVDDSKPKTDIDVFSGELCSPTEKFPAISIKGANNKANSVGTKSNSCDWHFGIKEQYNLPMSRETALRIEKTFNYLRNNKEHSIRLKDELIVFWSEDDSVNDEIFSNINISDDSYRNFKEAYNSIFNGSIKKYDDSIIHIISVVDATKGTSIVEQYDVTVKDFFKNLYKHYELMDCDVSDKKCYSLYSIYRIIPDSSSAKEIKKQIFNSIIRGRDFPQTLINILVKEILYKDDSEKQYSKNTFNAVSYKILRSNNIDIEKMKEESLAFKIGRMISVVTKMQAECYKKYTIKQRLFRLFESNPIAGFNELYSKKNTYLDDLKRSKSNVGKGVYLDKMFSSISIGCDDIDNLKKFTHIDVIKMNIGNTFQDNIIYSKSESVESEIINND